MTQTTPDGKAGASANMSEVVECGEGDARREAPLPIFVVKPQVRVVWNFIFVDEGQFAKNPGGSTHNMLRLLKLHHLVWTTGTLLALSSFQSPDKSGRCFQILLERPTLQSGRFIWYFRHYYRLSKVGLVSNDTT
jgi:hypothetical protein